MENYKKALDLIGGIEKISEFVKWAWAHGENKAVSTIEFLYSDGSRSDTLMPNKILLGHVIKGIKDRHGNEVIIAAHHHVSPMNIEECNKNRQSLDIAYRDLCEKFHANWIPGLEAAVFIYKYRNELNAARALSDLEPLCGEYHTAHCVTRSPVELNRYSTISFDNGIIGECSIYDKRKLLLIIELK